MRSGEVADYLNDRREDEFCIAPFVDYRGKDGLFREYRVALIDGRPYAVHMAISQHWMIHYFNADMEESEAKRAEEAQCMADFDEDFAVRHKKALDAIGKLAGLEYLPFDCGETSDGKLLIFETGTNMIVHSMDPVTCFLTSHRKWTRCSAHFRPCCENAVACRQRAIGNVAESR